MRQLVCGARVQDSRAYTEPGATAPVERDYLTVKYRDLYRTFTNSVGTLSPQLPNLPSAGNYVWLEVKRGQLQLYMCVDVTKVINCHCF